MKIRYRYTNNMSHNSKIYIAKLLKELRIQSGLTQYALAKNAAISTNSYARIERGEVSPSIDTFEKLVQALGVTSSDILPF
jgi:transcriptional regulator with XRE-family HTH domain